MPAGCRRLAASRGDQVLVGAFVQLVPGHLLTVHGERLSVTAGVRGERDLAVGGADGLGGVPPERDEGGKEAGAGGMRER